MSETVDVPKIGRVKKTYAYGTLAAVGGYVAWRYWRAGSGGAAPAPDGTMDDSSVTDAAPGSFGPGNTQYAGSTTTGGDEDNPVITTNDQWSRRALELATSTGWDAQKAAAAIGKYLGRQKLTAFEATVMQAIVALAGPPPVGGPYTITQGVETPPPSTHVARPKTPLNHGINTLHADNVIVAMSPSAGATKYQVDTASRVTTFTTPSGRVKDLRPKTRYSARVRAGNSAGWSPWSKYIYYTTPAKG